MTTPGDHNGAIDMRDPAIALNLLSRIPLPLADLHGAELSFSNRAPGLRVDLGFSRLA